MTRGIGATRGEEEEEAEEEGDVGAGVEEAGGCDLSAVAIGVCVVRVGVCWEFIDGIAVERERELNLRVQRPVGNLQGLPVSGTS